MARAFQDAYTDTGWLGRRVLRYREAPEGNAILSFEPASLRTIFVEFSDGSVEEMTIPLPALILLGKGRDYYLWAAGTSDVTAKTKLSVAPLPNIGSGKVCFGKNEVPDIHPSTLSAVWKLIFETPFNHDHVNGRCHSEPEDVRTLLKKLAADNVRKFPNTQLIVSTSTVEDAWERIVEQRSYGPRF